MTALLEIAGLAARYGRVPALRAIDMRIEEGTLTALVGANGAGKTTLMRVISGLLHPHAGAVRFAGTDITHLIPAKRVRLGIAQVPEGRQIFAAMSVEDNLRMGGFTRAAVEVSEGLARAFALFPVLGERRHQLAGTLSGGQQQMLAMARALMSKPKLLLLDEPSMGLAPLLVAEIFRTIQELKQSGVTIFLVEQNAQAALRIADYGYVMETGRIALEGSGAELLAHDGVRRSYLGL
ncbi:MAG TPA: ABC transporter ATP-binding protein [Stellaceae bacterium]|nr:ABC transporter ATP-binding protein [Stellaceae bacterium]